MEAIAVLAALASPIRAAPGPVSDAEEERLLLEGAIVDTDELPGGTSDRPVEQKEP